MAMEVEELKKVGKDIKVQKRKHNDNIQSYVLAIVKKATLNDKAALTQKEVSTILSKQFNRDIRPQQARSCLHSLIKQNKVVRRVLETPDTSGNQVFYYYKQ